MKKLRVLGSLLSLVGLIPAGVQAQNYDTLWKEVEVSMKKDLPQSVISGADAIYEKARVEKNIPQMMKAYLVRADYRISLTPDSADAEKCGLEQWAETETNAVGRAVLNSLLGNLAAGKGENLKEALRYFRLSLKERELLERTSAKAFRPMTLSGKLSTKYFGDNMYDLLARQAIRALTASGRWPLSAESLATLQEAYSFYDDLIKLYEPSNRQAAFLCKEARLYYRKQVLGGYTKYKLSADEFAGKMLALADAYGDLPVSADAYLKAADAYADDRQWVKAVEVARKALKQYPKGEWTKDLKGVIARAETPRLSAKLSFVYPRHETNLQVTFANLNKVTFELYRLNLTAASEPLNSLNAAELVKRYGKKVSSRSYALEPAADYTSRDTTLRYTLPEAGIYVWKQIPQEGKGGSADYSLVYVSPYQFVSIPVKVNVQEVIAIDRLSGHPVPFAEVATYTDARKLHKVYKTDRQGHVSFYVGQGYYANVRTADCDFMNLSYLSQGLYDNSSDEKGWKRKMHLFTDRALYRPGQTVHVSGLLFGQEADSVRVLKGKSVQLKLYRAGQTLAEKDVTSDSFGTIAADFVLPESLLPGRYNLSTENATIGIDVEEYKRPTFDVNVSYTGSYVMGDTLRLQGEAKAFSGAPVRDGKVKYRFTRGVRDWWRWVRSDESTLAEGEAQTDADGKFEVKVCLEKPEEVLDEAGWARSFYDYTLTADVTSTAGETQSGTLSLPVSRQSLSLSVNLPDETVMREKQPAIQFRAMNLLRKPVDAKISYRVFRAAKDNKKGEQVYEGVAQAQQSFVPADVWALPSGQYVMELYAHDDQGRECKAEQTFTLFSKGDKQIPTHETAWFYTDGDVFSTENVPTFYVGTSEENVYLMLDVYSGGKRVDTVRTLLNKELRAFSYPYGAKYGDGIRVVASFVRQSVLYSQSMCIVRRQPDKKLSLQWETFRDKLRPGHKEEWRIRISGPSGLPVKANLMATLYDASLDKLKAHDWGFGLSFPRYVPWLSVGAADNNIPFVNSRFPSVDMASGMNLINYPSCTQSWNTYKGDYSTLIGLLTPFYSTFQNVIVTSGLGMRMKNSRLAVADLDLAAPMEARAMTKQIGEDGAVLEESAVVDSSDTAEEPVDTPVSLRQNFAETAFFYPQLRTDSLGQVTVAFTVPDALTEWKFLGFAHTPNVDFGTLTGKTVTQKQFMVQPNMPRFVRRGDRAVVAASLVNLSAGEVKGSACIELSDPVSGKVVYRSSEAFVVTEGKTSTVRFGFDVPQSYDVLVCKIIASAGEYSDGEQHYLPVLTDKQWVTETIPVQLNGEGTKTVQTDKLFNGQSQTATDRRLTVELTANPDWYAVQALPAMSNPQTEDALAWASAYYANVLAKRIVDANPRIKQVFETWKSQGGDKETLQSNLQRNQDLKNLLLKETPWLTDAADETEQKQRIAVLFDLNTMPNRLQTAVKKLAALQNADGSWSWYKGMTGSRFVTTQVVEMLARLKGMNASLDGNVYAMYNKALAYLSEEANAEYQRDLKDTPQSSYVSEQIIHYLYICAIDSTARQKVTAKVNTYFIEKLMNRSADYTIYGKALMAIVMQGANKSAQADELVRSVKEYSVAAEDMGRYFDTDKAYYSWRNYKIPTQVAAMEAIHRIAPDEKMLNEMKHWLLKQKQVQAWESSVATADAVYAFLCMNGNKLDATGQMKAQWGKVSIQTPHDALGYTSRTLTGADAKVKQINVSKVGKGMGWGAVYAQCQEDMDKLSAFNGKGITVTRSFWRAGEQVTRNTVLHVGDKLTVRLTVKADRDMDFIQLKDERAACMESQEQLSGYKWNNGMGYYQANHDASTEFFIDNLRKGTYQIEYEVNIDRAGTYQSGVATIQSAYAPEFGGHTQGGKFTVAE